jgi:multiple sugar transport system substrate-binding protein
MRRRFVVAVLSALAVLAPAACSSNDSGTGGDKDALTIWIRQAPESDSAKTAQKLADAFTQKTNIKTKVVAIFDDFETKLQQQAAQKDLPAIVINDTAQLGAMQQQGWLQAVDKNSIAGGADLSDRAWKAAEAIDGKHYAMPFSAQAFALIVREDWRKKVGAPEPKTWEDVAAMAAAFTTKDPDGNKTADTYGYVIPGTTQRGYMSWYFSSWLWANGGNWVEEAGPGKWKPAINNDKSVEAAKWLQGQFCTAKTVIPGAVNTNTTTSHETFEKGKAGIYLVGPYVLARFVKSLGTDKVQVYQVPKGTSGGPGTLAEGENVYLMAGYKKPDDQKKFAEFAASPEGQKIGMNKDAAGAIVRLPVNKNVDMATERQDPRWKVFEEAYNTAGVYTPNVPNWAAIRQLTADGVNAVMADCTKDVRQAMDGLAQQLGAELQRQNVLAA